MDGQKELWGETSQQNVLGKWSREHVYRCRHPPRTKLEINTTLSGFHIYPKEMSVYLTHSKHYALSGELSQGSCHCKSRVIPIWPP